MIRLWTFQTEDAFHEFEKNGCLVGNFSEPNYAQAYDWMVNEMKKKIGPPAVEGQYPIWAWYKCEDVDVQTGHLHVGQKGVRIEFEIDPSQAVLFADDGWMHSVNYGYLGTSEEDCENFYKEVNDAGLYHLDHPRFIPLPEPYNQRIQKSWERIFDLDWVVEGWTVLLKDRFVRAALWKLNKDQVRDVKWFTAKEQMSDWKELDIDINGLSSNAVHSKIAEVDISVTYKVFSSIQEMAEQIWDDWPGSDIDGFLEDHHISDETPIIITNYARQYNVLKLKNSHKNSFRNR